MSTAAIGLEEAREVLEKHWGHKKFRKAQESVIQAALDGEDVLAVLATGYGKSATFQIPAMLYEGCAIVVSPLIALMKDQTDDCLRRGIPASYVNSHVEQGEQEERFDDLVSGEYKVFYIAPERIANHAFQDALLKTDVSYIVVDEAHCASRWGHDFRPAYMKIKNLVECLTMPDGSRPPVLAVTATATGDIEDDIAEALGMDNGYTRIVGDPVRPNLRYEVMHGNPWGNLRTMINQIDITNGRYVVYVGTRKGSEKVAEMVNATLGYGCCGVYHAGMNKPDREKVQDEFKSGKIAVVCATCAFGMGIDVPDIRFVIHFGIPGSLEDYCQESGRAGRDGKTSIVVLIHDDFSVQLRENFLDMSNPPYAYFTYVWEYLHAVMGEGETLKMSAANIALAIQGDAGVCIADGAINGVLSTMDAYGIVHRAYTPAGTAIKIHVDKLEEAMEGGSARLKGQTANVATYIWEAYVEQMANARESFKIIPVEVATDTMSVKTGLPVASIKRVFVTLKKKGLIEVEPSFNGKSTKILKYGEPLDDILPKDKIEEKRNRELDRLQKMIDYTTTRDRVQFIRDYFLKGL